MNFGNCESRHLLARVLCLAAVASIPATSANAEAYAEAVAACYIKASTGLYVEDTVVAGGVAGFSDFPLELSEPIWDQLMLDEFTDEWGGWCYANKEGRVRGRVITGSNDNTNAPTDGHVFLKWYKYFERAPGTPDPVFTVNASHLRMRADARLVDAELAKKSFAEMRLQVYVQRNLVFAHHSRMEGQPSEGTFQFDEFTLGDAGRLSVDGTRSFHPASEGTDAVETGDFAIYQLPEYTQSIDLDRYGIPIGSTYTVEYELWADAGNVPYLETWAEAFIGDPLDPGSGFFLSTDHETVEAPLNRCEAAPDPNRYEDHGDGTLTDSRTGLMWQRCPAGMSLDDAGTPGDTSDDVCVAAAQAAPVLDWQAALQAASDATAGGHHDWRAPNAKELETLVEACPGLAQIDPLAFPGTPGSRFWTATPEPNGTSVPRRSWVVDFGSGELAPASRVSGAYLRAVRDTGAIPVPAGVSVSAGNAFVFEGDSGTTTLLLPVGLSAPSGNDVSVDYVVRGLDAVDNVDFTPAVGTLIIPANDTIAHVEVVVLGDTDVELNELIALEITGQTGASWLRKAHGIGTIIDDEPMFELAASVQVSETNTNEVQDILVKLDRPAVDTISIDYSTGNGSAVAGTDYLTANGTLTIQPGDAEAVLPLTIVGDLVTESVEQLQISFDNAIGAALLVSPSLVTIDIVDDDGTAAYGALNDTGVITCANGSEAMVTCPQAGYPGQDAEHGRDVTDADPSDGALGFSFVKRDAAGDALGNQAGLYSQEPWDCVEDQVTGLFWEVKTDVQADPRFSDHTFTWYNGSGSDDGGNAGTENGGACADNSSCDTEKYVAAANAAGLCGFNDWRLPSADELFNIAWLGVESFSGIDTAYFPNHFAPPDGRGYWSSTPTVLDPQSAMRVRLDAGVNGTATIVPHPKNSTHRIRLVRGSAQSQQ